MYIDTHAHLNMPEFTDLPKILDSAREAGLDAIINVAFDIESSRETVRLSKSEDTIFSAVGIHPHDAGGVSDSDFAELKKLSSHPKVVGIGETGLDFYRNLSSKEKQIESFRRHIRLAGEVGLPIIVHARRSYDEVLQVIHDENRGKLRGVMHCFSGDRHFAKLSLDLGFYISFAGTITFKKADELREVASFVPIESILIETDCPYLAPEPHRGKRNEPSYIINTARKIAEIRGMDVEEIAFRTSANAKELFAKLNV
jgi:TatD DNase family protein